MMRYPLVRLRSEADDRVNGDPTFGDMSPRGARVLLVEDAAEVRDFVQLLLTDQGYVVEAVPDGVEALAAARRTRPDIVVSDVVMPRMDGVGLLRALRSDAALRELPVILLSALADEDSRIGGRRAGADEYITKPFSSRELLAVVGLHVRLARIRRQATAQLRESEQRYRTCFESMDEGFAVIEVVTGVAGTDLRLLETNPAFGKHTGLSDTDGRTARELVPNLEPEWIEHLAAVVDSGEPARFTEFAAAAGRWYDVHAFRVGAPDSRRVAVLFNDVTDRTRAEEALSAAHDYLEERVLERTAAVASANVALEQEISDRIAGEIDRNSLRRQLASAEEEERRRLSRELHDSLGQHLTALALGLGEVARLVESNSVARERLARLQELTVTMTRDTHHFAVALRPPELDDVGLHSALTTHVERWSEHFGIAVDLQVDDPTAMALPADVSTAVYRIVQEALNNVAKHAQARQVSVLMKQTARELRVIVEDDGQGFDTGAAARRAANDRRLGLASMRERAALAGGTLVVESAPGAGTSLYVRIPVSEANAARDATSFHTAGSA